MNIVKDAYAITREDFAALTKEGQRAIEEELRQEWRTPVELWTKLNAEFLFDIDVAASEHNTLCSMCLTKAENALQYEWFSGRGARSAFCNPGFSEGEEWIRWAHRQTELVPGTVAVVIGLASIGSEWFKFASQNAAEIRLLNPRVQFAPARPDIIKKSSNPNETAAYIFRGRRPSGPAHITLQPWA